MVAVKAFLNTRLRFDRNEVSGAFGDIGTVFPLIIGIIMVTGLDGAWVFIAFGLMQIMTALVYGIPMPVQPLKAAAVLVITQKLSGGILCGGGLAIGIVMLVLTLTGLVDFLGKWIPKSVIRGIQMGLGLQLAMLALKEYIPSDSIAGYVLAAVAFIIIASMMGNKRFPPALIVIPIGIIYGIFFNYQPGTFQVAAHLPLPAFSIPGLEDIIAGFLALAIPQIPLSLGNSIYASRRLMQDYFPEKKITHRKIALTYSLMNIISPLIGGIPVCHGSGGMAGHYTFGARTGGSVFICGSLFLTIGLLSGANGIHLLSMFPTSLLGVILMFEGLALLNLVRDMTSERNDFVITLLVGICAISLPYGYAAGMAAGMLMHYGFKWKSIRLPKPVPDDINDIKA
jgi:hypothetical protein